MHDGSLVRCTGHSVFPSIGPWATLCSALSALIVASEHSKALCFYPVYSPVDQICATLPKE